MRKSPALRRKFEPKFKPLKAFVKTARDVLHHRLYLRFRQHTVKFSVFWLKPNFSKNGTPSLFLPIGVIAQVVVWANFLLNASIKAVPMPFR